MQRNKLSIIVTMTSWPPRINNVIKILDSVLRNTVQPDKIFLNLSTEEFPNKENDLPAGLRLFIQANARRIYVNWVDGPNTKAFKKITPILQYLNDDDIIISLDDDFMIPCDLIESRLLDFKIFKYQHPITPNGHDYSRTSKAGIMYYMSPTSLFTKRMLRGWEHWYTQDIINSLEDDRVNTYIMCANGYTFTKSTKYDIRQLISQFDISSKDAYALSKHYAELNMRTESLCAQMLAQPNTSIVVYSYVTNNKLNKPWPKIFESNNVTYVMFTDEVDINETFKNGWTTVKIPAKAVDYTYEDMNKRYKWDSYNLFADKYDYAIYIDSKVKICKDPNLIIEACANKIRHGFITYKYDYVPGINNKQHIDNYVNVYKHADYLIDAKAGIKNNIIEWKKYLENAKFPHTHTGLIEGCVIISDLKNVKLQELQQDIFNDYYTSGTLRDQLTVPYTLWRKGIDISEIYKLGNYCANWTNPNTFFTANSDTDVVLRRTRNCTVPTNKHIITLTSWPKRINNCATVIQSCLQQSVKPDMIYLNLSIEEFPNKEKDLPAALIQLAKHNQNFTINWVDGPNTKTFKKVFPILKYLNDDDTILFTDDDIILAPDVLKSRLNDFYLHNEKCAISGATPHAGSFSKALQEKINTPTMSGSTAVSLLTKKMLQNYEYLLTADIIKMYNDDIIYQLIVLLNGFKFEYCSMYPIWVNNKIDNISKIQPLTFYNNISGLQQQQHQGTYVHNTRQVIDLAIDVITQNKNKFLQIFDKTFLSYF